MRELARVLVRLNLETGLFHARADGLWRVLVASQPSERDYVRTLSRVYGFEAALEAVIAKIESFDLLVDMAGRNRSRLAAADLTTLGVDIAKLPLAAIPRVEIAESFGWLYVVERATFVHEWARRELEQRLPSVRNAMTYLSAYAGVVGARFDAFGQQLERVARTPALEARIVDGARDAFRAWQRWFEPK